MNLPQKNTKFLNYLDGKLKKRYIKYSESIGPGFLNKLKKFIYAPDLYIPHLLFRFGLIKLENSLKKQKLFWGKEIIKTSNPPDYFMRDIFSLSEINLTKFFIKNLRNNDVFYDIGGNYGFYTYLALEFCKKVHYFEPIDYIAENVELNTAKEINDGELFLNKVALSNENGIREFYLSKNDPDSSSLVVKKYNINETIILKVSTITLNEYLKNHDRPTFIKMDVEGAESLIIEGGLDFFKNYNPTISLEVWSKNNYGHISMKSVRLLRDLGYNSYFIDIEGKLHKIDGDLSEFVKKKNKGLDNFVFKKLKE